MLGIPLLTIKYLVNFQNKRTPWRLNSPLNKDTPGVIWSHAKERTKLQCNVTVGYWILHLEYRHPRSKKHFFQLLFLTGGYPSRQLSRFALLDCYLLPDATHTGVSSAVNPGTFCVLGKCANHHTTDLPDQNKRKKMGAFQLLVGLSMFEKPNQCYL